MELTGRYFGVSNGGWKVVVGNKVQSLFALSRRSSNTGILALIGDTSIIYNEFHVLLSVDG
jgi:hypothetical protein